MKSVFTVISQAVDSYLTNLMLRKLRDEIRVMTVVGEADCNISLSASGNNAERSALNKSIVALRREA